jgi:hypothetical protein
MTHVANPAVCAPGRRKRSSSSLGRDTCLTAEEERAALSKGGARSKELLTDHALAQKLRLKDVLRPRMPKEWLKNPHTWLSDIDINAAMHQYARIVPEFEYLGTLPVDFAETTRTGACVKLCSSKPFSSVYRHGKLGATVVNLDVHTGKGTHWVALALDCRKKDAPRLMFYDSTGNRPPKRWLKSTKTAKSPYAHILSAIPGSKLRSRTAKSAAYNRRTHQRKNTECGVFAMMFVDALVSGRSFEQHCMRTLSDNDAFRHRSVFFEPTDASGSQGVSWSHMLGR